MSQGTIEERLARLEQIVERLQIATPRGEPGRDDWRKTFGMFAGDSVMKEIIDNGKRIRDEDRLRPPL